MKRYKRHPVLFYPNRPGHIMSDSGFGICGSNTGDWDAPDVVIEDGICYEVDWMGRGDYSVTVKEDYYALCKKCLKKLKFDLKKQKKRIKDAGKARPIFAPFQVVDVEFVEHEI